MITSRFAFMPWPWSTRSTWRRSAGVSTGMLLLAISPLAGQGGSADARAPELVFSASRYAQEVSDAPASVTIITAEEIREYGYRTLADVLGAVRGFSTRSDFNYDYATVRGLGRRDYNTRILLLVDGLRTNGEVINLANLGSEALIDLSRVHHIEVIRGPGSAQYGTNAVFGVINIVTGRGFGIAGGASAGAFVGSLGSLGGGLSWGTPHTSPMQFMIGVNAARRLGADRYYPEFDTPGNNHGVAHGQDGEEEVKLITSGQRGDWSFEGAYSLRRRSIPTASFATNFNAGEDVRDRAALASVSYVHSFRDLSRLTMVAALSRSSYDGFYPYTPSSVADYAISNSWSLDAQYLRVVGPGHKLTVGSELRWIGDGSQGAVNRTPGLPDVPVFRDVQSQVEGAAFAQVEWHLGDHVLLTTGVRHDQYQSGSGSTNPRLALVVHPTEQTTVKILDGRAFREPDLYERFYRDGVTQKIPASLSAEHVHTTEVEVEHRVGGLTGSVSAYHVSTRDLINLTTDPTDSLLVFANQGSPTTRGVEFELRGRIGPVSGRASYAIQDAREADGTRPVDGPAHLARVGAAMPLLHGHANLAVEVRYVASRPTLNGADAPAYTLTNVTLITRHLNQRLELLVGVKDLFNNGHFDPGGAELVQNVLAQDGRTIRVGVRRLF